MKKITQEEWDRYPRTYKKVKKGGVKYMLYNENGMTVWGPVEITEIIY